MSFRWFVVRETYTDIIEKETVAHTRADAEKELIAFWRTFPGLNAVASKEFYAIHTIRNAQGCPDYNLTDDSIDLSDLIGSGSPAPAQKRDSRPEGGKF